MRHLKIRTFLILRCTLIVSLLLTGCDYPNKSVETQNAEFRKKQCADSALRYNEKIGAGDFSGAETAIAACSTHFPSEYGELYKTARTERLAGEVKNQSLSPSERLNRYDELKKYAPDKALQLSGLSEKIEKSKQKFDQEMVNRAKKDEAERKRRAKSKGVSIGMSKTQVLESSWGKPLDINRTTTVHGTREQWIYEGGYLYFDGEVLTTIQN